jgi:uncharacterized protein (DUF58 family)
MYNSTTLKILQLKAKRQVHTLLSGNNLSKLHGEGYDFSELREYQMGDDIRKINWTITAKLGKPYVKELHANRELSVVVCALMDGSLYFGEGNSKQTKLTEIATLLAYATQQNADLFTGIGYQSDAIYATPPTKQIYHIEEFSSKLYDASLLGTSLDYTLSVQDIFTRVHKPSLLFIVGDFLEEIDLSLLAQKHEVIAIIVRDRDEENPQKLGEIILKSPTSSISIESHFGQKSIKRYTTNLKEHDTKLIEHFTRYDIRYIKIFSDEEVLERLMGLFR